MVNSILVCLFLLGLWIVFVQYVEVPQWLNIIVSVAIGWFSSDISGWLFG